MITVPTLLIWTIFQYGMEKRCTWQPISSIDPKLLPDNLIDNSVLETLYAGNPYTCNNVWLDQSFNKCCLVCNNTVDLIYCYTCLRSFHLKFIDMENKDVSGTSNWHRKMCQNIEKEQSDDIMKGEISHDIIQLFLKREI